MGQGSLHRDELVSGSNYNDHKAKVTHQCLIGPAYFIFSQIVEITDRFEASLHNRLSKSQHSDTESFNSVMSDLN